MQIIDNLNTSSAEHCYTEDKTENPKSSRINCLHSAQMGVNSMHLNSVVKMWHVCK